MTNASCMWELVILLGGGDICAMLLYITVCQLIPAPFDGILSLSLICLIVPMCPHFTVCFSLLFLLSLSMTVTVFAYSCIFQEGALIPPSEQCMYTHPHFVYLFVHFIQFITHVAFHHFLQPPHCCRSTRTVEYTMCGGIQIVGILLTSLSVTT